MSRAIYRHCLEPSKNRVSVAPKHLHEVAKLHGTYLVNSCRALVYGTAVLHERQTDMIAPKRVRQHRFRIIRVSTSTTEQRRDIIVHSAERTDRVEIVGCHLGYRCDLNGLFFRLKRLWYKGG